MIPIRSLLGLASVPSHRTTAGEWFRRASILTSRQKSKVGEVDCVHLSDLPEPVRLAYQVRQAERSGLAAGVQDEAAHLGLMAKTMGTQKRAHDRAAIVAFVVKHRQAGLSWRDTLSQLASAGFDETPSKVTLKRWLKEVENVDPINWAPVLAPGYSTKGAPLAACHPDAWADYEARIAASGRNGTGANFKRLWTQTRAEADARGWAFPPYRTVMRHWAKLSVERQRTLELGAEAAARSLTHFFPRSLEGMAAMEQVEVDFREFKILCIWEDGYVGCPWVGLAGDRASSKIVGRTVQKSETAEGYVALTRNMVETHGIPDRAVQDNGAGGNGYRMMGGYTPLVRRKDKGERSAEWAVPGVYKFLGIEVVNHGPRMAWAKFVESLNSIMRHVDNDPAFCRAWSRAMRIKLGSLQGFGVSCTCCGPRQPIPKLFDEGGLVFSGEAEIRASGNVAPRDRSIELCSTKSSLSRPKLHGSRIVAGLYSRSPFKALSAGRIVDGGMQLTVWAKERSDIVMGGHHRLVASDRRFGLR